MTTRSEPQRLGQGDRCPHCGAKAGVTAESDGSYTCLVCGGARILVEASVDRPGGEKPLLENVKALRMKRAAWLVGAGLMGGVGILSLAVALVVVALTEIGVFGTVALGAMVLVPLILAVFGFRRVKAASEGVHQSLEEARRVVSAELLSARPDLDAAGLSRMLRVPDDEALELIAHAQVGTMLSPERAPDARWRVETGAELASPEVEAPEPRRERHRT